MPDLSSGSRGDEGLVVTDEDVLSVAGTRIAVRERPGQGRPLLLVHGNSASSATWDELFSAQELSGHRLVAPDLPGHGGSAPLDDPRGYSLPGYGGVVAGLVEQLDLDGAVLVGWSLGGHIVIEALPDVPQAEGVAVFGTPPLGVPPDMDAAFLPNPAVGLGFTETLDPEQAAAYANSFLAPATEISVEPFVADILATHGAARSSLIASVGEGRARDELGILAGTHVPVALLHGAEEQLVSLEYLRGVDAPTLWRGEVQVIEGAGHAPHVETPGALARLLAEFAQDLAG